MKTLLRYKFSILYALSFLVYPLMVFFEWINQIDEGGIWCVLAVLILFALTYLIFLRRKEQVSLGRSIARTFLYGFFALHLLTVLFLIEDFFFGYTETGLFWVGETYYGLEALREDAAARFLFIATLLPFVLYTGIYALVSAAMRNKARKHDA